MRSPWMVLVGVAVACGSAGLEVEGKPTADSQDSALLGDLDTSDPDTSDPDTNDPDTNDPDTNDPDTNDPDTNDPGSSVALDICVNEWVASNIGGLRLLDGSRPDWLELHNPGSTEVSLEGWTIGDSDDPLDAEPLLGAMVIPPGGELVLFADGQPELGPQHLEMSLDSDGETVALYAPDGRGEVVHYGEVEGDSALSRSTDCCRGDGCWSVVRYGSPGVGNADGGDTRETLVALGSEWRYLDTNEVPDPSWTTPSFSDAAWARGAAPLGFGDSHQVSFVASGPDGARHISTWFRQEFFVEEPQHLHDMELDLMLDDGARVWLNGTELLRVNLPTDVEIDSSTLANAAVGGSNETAQIRYAIDGAVLNESANVLAIEVHQASLGSSDLGLDAQLTALRL